MTGSWPASGKSSPPGSRQGPCRAVRAHARCGPRPDTELGPTAYGCHAADRGLPALSRKPPAPQCGGVKEVRTAETSPPRWTAHEGGRSPAFTADVHAIEGRLLSLSDVFVMARLATLASRRRPVDLRTGWGPVVVGVAGALLRVGMPVIAALAFGQLGESPVLRWALVAALLGALDATGTHRHRQSNPALQDFSALLWTMTRDEDAHDLLTFTRRWYRLRVSATFAATVALLVTLSCALTAPAALSALPVGSVVLLAMLAYEVGEIAFFMVGFMTPFLAREAQFDHRLFWLNPVESTPIRRVLRGWAAGVGFLGITITGYIVLAVVLVSPGSPLLLPVVAAFTVAGYFGTLIALVGLRRSIRTIAGRIRDESTETLQRHIDAYRGRLDSLAPHESEELERLVAMYQTVRAAPTTPRISETLGHAARAMLVPTLTFALAVSSEVYAERLLDQLLP